MIPRYPGSTAPRKAKFVPQGIPFPKGVSGNPGGRSSNEIRFTRELNRQLRTKARMATFTKAILRRAETVSDKLAIEVIARLDGKIPEAATPDQKLLILPGWMQPTNSPPQVASAASSEPETPDDE